MAETSKDRDAFLSIPIVQHAIRNGAPRSLYIDFLTEAYHHVKHTFPLLAFAASRTTDERYQDAGEMHRALAKVLSDRQPPSASDLARFVEVLFDRHEREEALPEDHPSGEHGGGSGERSAGAGGQAEFTAVPDPMSVDTLLKRFGIK